jgi:hypothetical protein
LKISLDIFILDATPLDDIAAAALVSAAVLAIRAAFAAIAAA